jgi:hypothetical protein
MRTRFPGKATLLAVVVVAIAMPLRAVAGCEVDTDCKGDRICENGVCTAPPPPPLEYVEGPETPWLRPRLHGARSFIAVGGVGDFVSPTYGGINGEVQATIRLFNVGILDGGLTFNALNDLGFANTRTGGSTYLQLGGGAGFDLGLLKFLQFGPRINLGWATDLQGDVPISGLYWSFGGHVICWLGHTVGLFAEADALTPISRDGPWGSRFAGGLAFALP